jgi:polysaccharide pyruvyl transferase WcaK-like protein
MCGVNLGDAATQDAMIYNLRRHFPGAEIFGVSLNPNDTERRHGIPAFPLHFLTVPDAVVPTELSATPAPRPTPAPPGEPAPLLSRLVRPLRLLLWWVRQEVGFALRTFRVARGLDVLVVSGGGQLSDEFENIPTKSLRWILLAKLAGVRVAFVSVGAGPLRTVSSRVACLLMLELADYRSFRDAGARELTRALGARQHSLVYPDLAHSLPVDTPVAPRAARAGPPVVAVGPIPYCHPRLWPVRDQSSYDNYVGAIAQFEAWLLGRGYAVIHIAGSAGDQYAIADVRAALASMASPEALARLIDQTVPWTVSGLVDRIASVDFVVTSRFHGVVLAHVLSKPTIAVSPHPKVSAVMTDAGLSEYDLPIQRLEHGALTGAFLALEANRDQVKASLGARERECRRLLHLQYRRVFR